MSENDLQQLNSQGEEVQSGETATVNPQKRKINKFVDILLWVIIAVLAIAVLVRAFFYTQITVSGESMTSSYYGDKASEHYNRLATLDDNEAVGVSKVKKPKRGNVVVFYKNDGANKFLDMFVPAKSAQSGEYEKLIKRIVAISGDKLWVEQVDGDKDLYRVVVETPDGETIHEDYYKLNGNILSEEAFYIKGTLATGSDLGVLSKHIGKENALEISENCIFVMGDNRSNSSDSRSFGEVPLSRLYGVVLK